MAATLLCDPPLEGVLREMNKVRLRLRFIPHRMIAQLHGGEYV